MSSSPSATSHLGTSFVSAFVLPTIAESDPGYVNDVLAAATNGSAAGDIGLLQAALKVSGLTFLGGGLLFGIALFRARVLAPWASVLLAVASVLTLTLAVLPDAFYRFLAFPNAIAMIGLGYSLWHAARTAPYDAAGGEPHAHVTTACAEGPTELRIQGHLDPHWSSWFDGITLIRENDGTTTLRGTVTDQAESTAFSQTSVISAPP